MDSWIGLAGVLVGVVLTKFSDYLTESRRVKKHAEYLAIRAVTQLDSFIDDCSDVVWDNGEPCGDRDNNDYGYRYPQVKLPSFKVDDLDVDWKSIPANLMYGVLSIESRINEANMQIQGTAEHCSGPPDFEDLFHERQKQYADLGIYASEIADSFRKKYAIPSGEYMKWDPVKFMKEKRAVLNS